MTAYGYDASACLRKLEEIAEELPPGIGPDFEADQSEHFKLGLNLAKKYFTRSIKDSLRNCFEKYEVEDKLLEIKRLAESSTESKAWRPETGHVDIKAIEYRSAETLKEDLLESIKLLDEEIEDKKSSILKWKAILDKGSVDMNKMSREIDLYSMEGTS